MHINGQPPTLQKDDKGNLVVPLANVNGEEPFVLEVRYNVSRRAMRTQACRSSQDDAAVQKVYLCAFVPAAQDVIGTSGSWSEDFRWDCDRDGRWM